MRTPPQFRVEAERQRDDALAELAAYKAGLGLCGAADDAEPAPEGPRRPPADHAEITDTTSRVLLNFRVWPRRLECTLCHAHQDLPETFTHSVFTAMGEAFKGLHADCLEGDGAVTRRPRRRQ